MECERLNRLVRSWYMQVQDEAMAPARMVEFMEKHISECEICLSDPDVRYEVKKITTIVLPESKIIKPAKKAKVKKEESARAEPVKVENQETDQDVKSPEENEGKSE
ncbi:MAG TPA: hypothetical protein EYP19_04930 [Desulfobacterales bacterium]|nr:hypothetical protein [Desulfobacterales bacterium]